MTKFSEFLSQNTPEKTPEGVAVGGSFGCQECPATVQEATYLRAQSVLTWTCPEGHISFIEGFSI